MEHGPDFTVPKKHLNTLRKEGKTAAMHSVIRLLKETVTMRKELPETDLYVPGKVLYAYSDGHGMYHAAVHDGTLPMLATIMPAATLITDHLSEPYLRALKAIGERDDLV